MRLLLTVWALFSFTAVLAQPKNDIQEETFYSKILHGPVKYSVYLPPSFDSAKKYPVIFSLHAFGGDHHSSDEFIRRVDSLIKAQQFPATVIIAPAAQLSWYIDDYAGKYPYASMFINEFVPFLDNKYSISSLAGQRAVTGISMGGVITIVQASETGRCRDRSVVSLLNIAS